MKCVRNLKSKLTRNDSGILLYQRDGDAGHIPIYPACKARENLAPGHLKSLTDDTDTLAETIIIAGHVIEPVVCAPPALQGRFLAGFINHDRDTLTLCEYPIDHASHAARCAHALATNLTDDPFEIINGNLQAVA